LGGAGIAQSVTFGIMYISGNIIIDVINNILLEGENISFDASLVIYMNSTSIPPIMIINRIYENQKLLYIVPLIIHTIVVCMSSIIPIASGLDGPESNPGGVRFFAHVQTGPEALYNGCRVFPGGKAAGA
jgi:hypothetical protein